MIASGKRVGTPTLRHRYTRNLLMNGIPINYLVTLAGAQLDPDDAHLCGTCAGPDEEPRDSAVS